jgi:hypothetical protein
MSTATGGPLAAYISVSAWGELPAERKLPGCLRVLVNGQSVGGAERVGAAWRAVWHTAAFKDRVTVHTTAELAVATVIASGWARRLGARASSPIRWTAKANRLGGRVVSR